IRTSIRRQRADHRRATRASTHVRSRSYRYGRAEPTLPAEKLAREKVRSVGMARRVEACFLDARLSHPANDGLRDQVGLVIASVRLIEDEIQRSLIVTTKTRIHEA